jgi:hypothetical protein
LASSRFSITASASVCTGPVKWISLPSSGAAFSAPAGSTSAAVRPRRIVAVMSVSWISPGRRVLSLVSQRGPLSGGSCMATSGS